MASKKIKWNLIKKYIYFIGYLLLFLYINGHILPMIISSTLPLLLIMLLVGLIILWNSYTVIAIFFYIKVLKLVKKLIK